MTTLAAPFELTRKVFSPEEIQFTPGEKSMVAWITCEHVDHEGDLVVAGGVDYTSVFMGVTQDKGNPAVFALHDYGRWPIGKCVWIKSKKSPSWTGLLAKTDFDEDADAQAVYQKIRVGTLKGVSIGFKPPVDMQRSDWGPPTAEELRRFPNWAGAKRVIRRCILLEYSICGLGMNSACLVVAVSKGLHRPIYSLPKVDNAMSETETAPSETVIDVQATVTDETEVKTVDPTDTVAPVEAETKAKPKDKAAETEPPSKPESPERIEETEDTDDDDREPTVRYKTMCKGLVKTAKQIKHSGKAGNLFAHGGKMEAHWQNHEDDQGDDAEQKGYHSAVQIREMLGKAPGCKGCACQKGVPTGWGWEKLKHGDEDEEAQGDKDKEKDKDGKTVDSEDEPATKDMSGASGITGGYTYGEPNPVDGPRKPEAEDIRRGHSVEIVGGGQKGFGKVVSIHKDNDFVPDVDDHVMGSEDEPAARVHRHKKMGDGFEPTGHYTAHKCMDLKRVPELKAPSKKAITSSTTVPAKASPAPKPAVKPEPVPAPAKKTLPPIEDVGVDLAQAKSLLLSETVKMLREDGQRQVDRAMGIV